MAASGSAVTGAKTQVTTNSQAGSNQQAGESSSTSPIYEPAIKILKERKTDGKSEYLVLFETREKCWANEVSPALERAFRIQQEQIRKKRRHHRRY